MSAFSIRKQSPHQSGNIESPSFSALRALRGWGMASLISKHRHAHRTAPSQGTPPLFGGDRLVVRFTVGPASAAKLAVLCISFCWQRFRPNHHIGQCSVVSGSQAVWCKMAVPPAEACGCCGNPTGTWWLGRWWADRASINLSTVSLTRSGEMRRNWGKLEWGEGREKLFNNCQMGFFVPLEGWNLRRAGVRFLCREMTRAKLETQWNFPFPQNIQNTLKDWSVLRHMRIGLGGMCQA